MARDVFVRKRQKVTEEQKEGEIDIMRYIACTPTRH